MIGSKVGALVESFELMAEIEASCARLAAQRLGAADRAAITRAHVACQEAVAAGDDDAYYPANAQFHAAIYAATGNRVLRAEAVRLQTALQPYRRLQLKVPRRIAASLAEHEAILADLIAGDGIAAADRMRAHVLVQGERFMSLLAALQQETQTDD
ncbi:FCD domain-containing protein [Starkeya koreensis]|uniref:FCD domain-containing protein n=1 Tax=Ancylobacter koreensis TaxID=266121 RepID=A0ABT0DGP7_9HYPH|nr:FCD domain-containing protein [Ancylobacter koreensis]MCK0206453.1 FCD domain-containing protein [Ancylobacter koreensis]